MEHNEVLGITVYDNGAERSRIDYIQCIQCIYILQTYTSSGDGGIPRLPRFASFWKSRFMMIYDEFVWICIQSFSISWLMPQRFSTWIFSLAFFPTRKHWRQGAQPQWKTTQNDWQHEWQHEYVHNWALSWCNCLPHAFSCFPVEKWETLRDIENTGKTLRIMERDWEKWNILKYLEMSIVQPSC